MASKQSGADGTARTANQFTMLDPRQRYPLRELRQVRALTAAELAMRAHCSTMTVLRAERGLAVPSARIRRAIAEALAHPVERILFGLP